MCAAKENKFLPTDQCVMTEMPKFLAYGCSALGSYFLAKNLYPAVANPQVDLVDNSQNGGGEAPLNSTRNPQQGNVRFTQDSGVTAEIGFVTVVNPQNIQLLIEVLANLLLEHCKRNLLQASMFKDNILLGTIKSNYL